MLWPCTCQILLILCRLSLQSLQCCSYLHPHSAYNTFCHFGKYRCLKLTQPTIRTTILFAILENIDVWNSLSPQFVQQCFLLFWKIKIVHSQSAYNPYNNAFCHFGKYRCLKLTQPTYYAMLFAVLENIDCANWHSLQSIQYTATVPFVILEYIRWKVKINVVSLLLFKEYTFDDKDDEGLFITKFWWQSLLGGGNYVTNLL